MTSLITINNDCQADKRTSVEHGAQQLPSAYYYNKTWFTAKCIMYIYRFIKPHRYSKRSLIYKMNDANLYAASA